jgi:hypothetical protein
MQSRDGSIHTSVDPLITGHTMPFYTNFQRKAYICKEYEPVLLDKIYIKQHFCKRRPHKHHRLHIYTYIYTYLIISDIVV